MKGQISEACLGFIRWGKGGGGGGELQHLAILPLHCHFILFIKFSLLPINPYNTWQFGGLLIFLVGNKES